MTTLSSPAAIAGTDAPFNNPSQISRLIGVRKQLTRQLFDAAITAERLRITNNSTGIYLPGEEFQIIGEVGIRQWTLATGGSDASNASNSHARKVLLPNGKVVLLASDTSVVQTTSGIPSNSILSNGDLALDFDSGIYYTKSSGAWSNSGSFSGGVSTPVIPTPVALVGGTIPLNSNTELIPLNLTSDIVFTPNTSTAIQGAIAKLSVLVSNPAKRITFDSLFKQSGTTAIDYTQDRILEFTFKKTGLSYLWDVVIGAIYNASSIPSFTGSVGDQVYFPLEPGVMGTIQVQRDGVDIAGAVSDPNSNSYTYTLTSQDDGKALTVRVTNITYDTTAARMYSIQVKDSEPDTVEIVYDKTLQTTSINGAHFTLGGISGKTMNQVSVIATNNILKVKYSSNFAYGELPTFTLSQNGTNDFSDYAGNLIPTFTNLAVANNIESPAVPEAPMVANVLGRDATLGFFNEMGGITCHGFNGDGTNGTDFSYILVATTAASPNEANPDWLYADGWLEMQCQDASAIQRQMGLSKTQSADQDYKNEYLLKFTNGTLQPAIGHASDPDPQTIGVYVSDIGPTFTFPNPSASCWARLRRFEDSIRVEYSVNNKTSWTVLYTFAASETDPLFGRFGIKGLNTPIVGAALKGFAPLGTVDTI